MEQYIEDKKVLGVTILEEKTPGGNSMVSVAFEDGTFEVMPEARFNIIKTSEISNASQVQEKILSQVGAVLYGMLHEYGIKMGEAEEVLNSTSTYINSGYEKARDIIWGISHRKLPLIQINKILIKEHAKENNNGTTS